jgi:large subunit ribosomal protein L22
MTDEPETTGDEDLEETAPAAEAERSSSPEASEVTEESRPASPSDADSSADAEDVSEPVAAEEAQEPEAEEEPKPKPRRRRRKAAEPVAEEAPAEAETDEETEAVAAEAAGAGADAPEADVEEAPAAPARPSRSAPSRRRGRRDPDLPAPVVRAQAKYVRSSARKARLVCDHIRGKSVEEARAILALTPRAIARDWSKLLESAVANAEHNHELVGEDLYVKAVHADEGPTIKRFRPRAMGRATRIRKRTSHLTILLTSKD